MLAGAWVTHGEGRAGCGEGDVGEDEEGGGGEF